MICTKIAIVTFIRKENTTSLLFVWTFMFSAGTPAEDSQLDTTQPGPEETNTCQPVYTVQYLPSSGEDHAVGPCVHARQATWMTLSAWHDLCVSFLPLLVILHMLLSAHTLFCVASHHLRATAEVHVSLCCLF